MQDKVLEELIREQLGVELPGWLLQWEICLRDPIPNKPARQQGRMYGLARLDGLADSPRLARLIELTRQSRNIARLTHNEEMEAVSVSLEAVLSLTSETDLPDASIRKTILLGAELLRKNLAYDFANAPLPTAKGARIPSLGPASISTPLSPLSASVIERLQTAVKSLTTGGAYGGLGVCFSVMHAGVDSTPLRLRGLDLYRLEQQNVHLYLLEVSWQEVLERNRGLVRLLEYLGRNGQVFDIRPTSSFFTPSAQGEEHILRILYGSPLDLDFVEALIRLPSSNIHSVNPAQVRRNQPSWGVIVQEETPVLQQQQACSRSVEALTLEYTVALNRLFTESKAKSVIWKDSHTWESQS